MPQADSAEEFKDEWKAYISQLYKMGDSLPEDELEEFMNTVQKLENFTDKAAEHTFENED